MPHGKEQVQLRLTRITATGRATKQHRLKDGEIETDSAPLVYDGTGEVLTATPSLEALADVLRALGQNQCLLYGVPASGLDRFTLTTKARRSSDDPPNRIARCNASFCWPSDIADIADIAVPLLLDHDAGGDRIWTPEESVAEIAQAVPAFAEQRYLVWPSSSSYLRDRYGNELCGLRGYHLYTLVPGGELPAIVAHLRETLAARGHVRYEISAVGSLLQRGLFDWSVHQPERIDYVAPPVCKDGIEAFGREVHYVGGDRDILPSGDWTTSRGIQEAAKRNRAAAREAREPEAREKRKAHIEEDAQNIVKKDATVPIETARERARAVFEHGDLHADFPIVISDDGEERVVTVREICAERDRYHQMQTLDPVEPEYRERKVVGIIYANPDGSTVLHSQAHGGKTYRLHGRPMLILREGRMHEAVEDAVRMMAASGRFFALGGSVAIIGKGALR